MKKRRLTTRIVCLILGTITAFCLFGCTNDKPEQSELEKSLTISLKNYLDSDGFKSDVLAANTARDRLLLLYTRYTDKNLYDSGIASQFKLYLNFMSGLIDDGELSDEKFASSPAAQQGWRGIPDYLYSWSLIYNQYAQYRRNNGINDTTYDNYIPAIQRYIASVDDYLRTGETTDGSAPVTTVAWAHDITNVLPMVAANLGIKDSTPYCDSIMLSYYEKTSDGYEKEGGACDWVGFSGRPLCASLYVGESAYDVKYEKTMQGYFPFTDGWDQPLDEMVNLDRLCDYYGHTLESGADAAPQFALLTAMAHGIDVWRYKKEVPSQNDAEDKTYDILSLWKNGLTSDENGNYVIDDLTDMAVAISCLANIKGVKAPSPLGRYSPESAVICL